MADPWSTNPDEAWNAARKKIEMKWYRNRYKKDTKPVSQQPSQEYKDQGFRSETELAYQVIKEWLDLSIGISNLSVAS